MIIKKLIGHSGCDIILYKENEKYFVRKISKSKEYNDRLKKQCIKQQNDINGYFSPVKVLRKNNIGDDVNDLFYFDMEYIQGNELYREVEKLTLVEIKDLAEKFVFELFFNHKTIMNKSASKELEFIDKIKLLKKKIGKEYTDSIKILNQYNWLKIELSYCHGDLTFENIICDLKGQYYLIDYLDSFYDTKWIDIAKLFQDLECYWSWRNKKIDYNLLIKINKFKEVFLNNVNKEKKERIYIFLLLNLIRIIPYTNSFSKKFIDLQINNIMKKHMK